MISGVGSGSVDAVPLSLLSASGTTADAPGDLTNAAGQQIAAAAVDTQPTATPLGSSQDSGWTENGLRGNMNEWGTDIYGATLKNALGESEGTEVGGYVSFSAANEQGTQANVYDSRGNLVGKFGLTDTNYWVEDTNGYVQDASSFLADAGISLDQQATALGLQTSGGASWEGSSVLQSITGALTQYVLFTGDFNNLVTNVTDVYDANGNYVGSFGAQQSNFLYQAALSNGDGWDETAAFAAAEGESAAQQSADVQNQAMQFEGPSAAILEKQTQADVTLGTLLISQERSGPSNPLLTASGTLITSTAEISGQYDGAGNYVGSVGIDPSTQQPATWDASGHEIAAPSSTLFSGAAEAIDDQAPPLTLVSPIGTTVASSGDLFDATGQQIADSSVLSHGSDPQTPPAGITQTLSGYDPNAVLFGSTLTNALGEVDGTEVSGYDKFSTITQQGTQVSVYDSRGNYAGKFGIDGADYYVEDANGVIHDATDYLTEAGINSDVQNYEMLQQTQHGASWKSDAELESIAGALTQYALIASDVSGHSETNVTDVYDASGSYVGSFGAQQSMFSLSAQSANGDAWDETSAFMAAEGKEADSLFETFGQLPNQFGDVSGDVAKAEAQADVTLGDIVLDQLRATGPSSPLLSSAGTVIESTQGISGLFDITGKYIGSTGIDPTTHTPVTWDASGHETSQPLSSTLLSGGGAEAGETPPPLTIVSSNGTTVANTGDVFNATGQQIADSSVFTEGSGSVGIDATGIRTTLDAYDPNATLFGATLTNTLGEVAGTEVSGYTETSGAGQQGTQVLVYDSRGNYAGKFGIDGTNYYVEDANGKIVDATGYLTQSGFTTDVQNYEMQQQTQHGASWNSNSVLDSIAGALTQYALMSSDFSNHATTNVTDVYDADGTYVGSFGAQQSFFALSAQAANGNAWDEVASFTAAEGQNAQPLLNELHQLSGEYAGPSAEVAKAEAEADVTLGDLVLDQLRATGPASPLISASGTVIGSPHGISALFNTAGNYVASLGLDPTTGALTFWNAAGQEANPLSGLTSSFLANLAPSSVAAIDPTIIANFSNVQVGALNGADVAHMTNAQLSAINAWYMTWFDIFATSQKQMGAFSADQLNQLNVGQITNLSSLQVAGIAPAAIALMTQNQIDQLINVDLMTGAQTAAMSLDAGSNLGQHALSTFQADALAGFTVPQVGKWNAEQVSSLYNVENMTSAQTAAFTLDAYPLLTQHQLSSFSADALSGFDTAGLAALSDSQISDIYNVAGLTSNQISSLQSDQIQALLTSSESRLTAVQIGSILPEFLASSSTALISALTKSQIGGLTAAQFASLSDDQIATLADVSDLTSQQTSGLTASNIGRLAISELSPSAIGGISAEAAPGLTQSQIAALSSTQQSALSQDAVVALTPAALSSAGSAIDAAIGTTGVSQLTADQVGALSVAATGGLSVAQVATLNTEQIAALSGAQIASLGDKVASLSVGGIETFDVDQVADLTGAQIAVFSPLQVGAFSDRAIASLSAAQISGFTAAQVAALSASQVSSISWLASLSAGAVQAFDGTQVAALTTSQLGELANYSINALSSTEVAALTAAQVSSLTQSQLANLTPQSIANLGASGLSALSAAQLQSLTATQLVALSTQQIASLSSAQIQALTPDQIANLEGQQIESFSTVQIQSLTAAQIGRLTTGQVSNMRSVLDEARRTDGGDTTSVSATDLTAFNFDQLQSLRPDEISLLSGDQLRGLTSTQLQTLSGIQLASLSSAQLETLSPDQLRTLVAPLASLGVETGGYAPDASGNEVGQGAAIVPSGGDPSNDGGGFIVVDNADGTQSVVLTSSDQLVNDGSFEAPLLDGAGVSSSTPLPGVSPVPAPPSPPTLGANQIFLQGTPYDQLIATATGGGWYRVGSPSGGNIQISYNPGLNQWDYSNVATGHGVWQSGLGGRDSYKDVYASYESHFGDAPPSPLAPNQIYINGTPYTGLKATSNDNGGWYYATDPADSNFAIGYAPSVGLWSLKNLTTGNTSEFDDATSYVAAFQTYQATYGDAPSPTQQYSATYVPIGVTVGTTDGTHSFVNTAAPGSAIGYTGILSDNGDSSGYRPVNGSQAALIGGTGSISQTLNNLAAGQWYAISFSAITTALEEQADTSAGSTISVGRGYAAPQEIQITLDGQSLGVFQTSAPTDLSETSSVWPEFATAAFVGSAGNHVLTIQGLAPDGSSSSLTIDAVSLLQVTPDTTAQQPAGGIDSLQPSAIGALDPLVLLTASNDQLQHLSKEQFQQIQPSQLKFFWGTAINRFTPTELSWLTTDQLQSMPSDQIAQLGAALLNGFSLQQLQALPTLSSISTADLQNLLPSTIANFSALQDSTLTRLQLASLSATQIQSLNSGAWSLFNATQISGLSGFQLSAVSKDKLASITPQGLAGLPEIDAGLSLQAWLATPSAALPDGSLPTQTTSGALTLGMTIYDNNAPDATPDFDSDFADESVEAGTYSIDDANTAATFVGTAGVTADGSSISGGNDSPGGDDAAFIQGSGSFSESISGLAAGEDYQIAFDASQGTGSNEAIEVLVDGKAVGEFNPGAAYGIEETDAFTVNSSGPHTVTFAGVGSAENTALIDGLHIALAGDSEVLSGGAILQDGGFALASAHVVSQSDTPAASPWTFSGPSGIEGPESSAFVYNGGSVSQTVAGFEANRTYTIAFDAAQVGASTQTIQVLVDGNIVGTVTPSDQNYRLEYTATFAPGAGAHTITLRGVNAAASAGSAEFSNVRVLATGLQSDDASVANEAFDPASGSWTFSGSAGIQGNAAGLPLAFTGTNAAYLSGGGTVSQQIDSFRTGDSYVLSFRAAQEPGSNQQFNVLVDGTVVGSFTPSAQYQAYTTSVFAPGPGAHTITFEGIGAGSALISDVELGLLPSSPISNTLNSDGTPMLDHAPSQDEIQRLQWASLTESAALDEASADGGDDMLSVVPDTTGLTAGPDEASNADAFQLGWSSGDTITESINISADNSTITKTYSKSDGSAFDIEIVGSASDPSNISIATETVEAYAPPTTGGNGSSPTSPNGAPETVADNDSQPKKVTLPSPFDKALQSAPQGVYTGYAIYSDVVAFDNIIRDIRKGGIANDINTIAQLFALTGLLLTPTGEVISNPADVSLYYTAQGLATDSTFMGDVSTIISKLSARKDMNASDIAAGAALSDMISRSFVGNAASPPVTGLPPGAPPQFITGASMYFSAAAAALKDLSTIYSNSYGTGTFIKDVQDVSLAVNTANVVFEIANHGIPSAALKNLAGQVGAVVGIIQGFDTGGVFGGLQAGWSADSLALMLGAASGVALPIGLAVATISAFFGGNHDVPANMPDKYDTVNYGQGIANLTGFASANGQTFRQNAAFKSSIGMNTGIEAVEKELARFSDSGPPAWLAPMYDQLKAMFGVSATGSGQLQIGNNGSGVDDNNQRIVGVPGVDGNVYQYTQLDAALNAFNLAFAKAVSSGQAVALSWTDSSDPTSGPPSQDYDSTSYLATEQYS